MAILHALMFHVWVLNHGGRPSDKSYARESQSTTKTPSLREMLETEAEVRQVVAGGTAEDASGLSNAALPDYIETLKRKVEDVGDQSRRQRPRLAADTSDGRTSQSPNIPTEAAQNSPQTSHDTPLTEQTSITERSVQAAMGEIEFLSRNAMAEPRGEASGFPQELAIGSMIKASLAISGRDPTRSLCSLSPKSRYTSMLGQAPALTREIVVECMDRFFDGTKALCPYIDEGELLGYRDSFFDSSQEPQKTSYTAFRDFNVYMAAAIGILLSPESSVEMFASSLHSAAMQRFPSILGGNDDMNMLHSLVLLIIYSMFSSTGGSTWHLVGLAMKKAISYRFHKEPLSDLGIPEQTINRRRSIFWNLYILDRTISCAMDRPFSIEDEDITLQHPSYGGGIHSPDSLDFPADFINNEYLAVEDGCFTGSFVDAFDIFSAGVVIICLGRISPSFRPSNTASVLNKCTALMTLLGERFTGLKAFCKVLWCLQESTDMIIDELPEIVPHGLQVMIEGAFRSNRAVR
ncbi:hypothetical protein AbraIFM66951_005803 [Aspergillus brasiliensis]|uniref:Xylanolytic transcriptional activator regulatory domain-containing protein n=1 Tax=Aspergillus brasiliensis TaxID=319629 RepID=A0A9W5Z1V4_9EURO|nr:hypothetical protein AbraCBS73388_003503 [Aspergillus brasiliensis]GKZ51455.1 hypothetical protein AbraIFM66951_005803 [Aspergillus brasiliensis]